MTKTQNEASASPPEVAQSTCELIYTDPASKCRCKSQDGLWAAISEFHNSFKTASQVIPTGNLFKEPQYNSRRKKYVDTDIDVFVF